MTTQSTPLPAPAMPSHRNPTSQDNPGLPHLVSAHSSPTIQIHPSSPLPPTDFPCLSCSSQHPPTSQALPVPLNPSRIDYPILPAPLLSPTPTSHAAPCLPAPYQPSPTFLPCSTQPQPQSDNPAPVSPRQPSPTSHSRPCLPCPVRLPDPGRDRPRPTRLPTSRPAIPALPGPARLPFPARLLPLPTRLPDPTPVNPSQADSPHPAASAQHALAPLRQASTGPTTQHLPTNQKEELQ